MRRQWENFWEEEVKDDFMRLDWQFTHPARKLVYEETERLGESVLDVGCGTGIDYEGFILHGIEYTGVDITPKFIENFKRIHPEADVSVHSSLSLPFPPESFDVVYAGGMIQHMHPDDYPEAIESMWKICRRGLILTTSKFFTKKTDIIQKVRKDKVYDNHYGKEPFLKIIHSLPRFKSVKFHENIKHTAGEPYTVIIITKEVEEENI